MLVLLLAEERNLFRWPSHSENTPDYEFGGQLGSRAPARRINTASHVSDYLPSAIKQ
jgi:hypothetical protein